MSTMPAGWTLKGRYVLEEVVGQGSMGAVYRAVDQVSGVDWAVKEVDVEPLDAAEAAEVRELFVRESEILLQLSHPCFPLVMDCFSQEDRYYLVMEFIRGRTLESIVEKIGSCPERWLLPLARELAAGLQVLHTHRGGPVIFRDLKPGNVMITDDDRVMLVDFGIARRYKPEQEKDTHPMGTPGFAAPEQYGLAQSTPRSDLYGLGATLYFALTGRDCGMPGTVHAPLRALAPACSQEMEDLLERCLQADPLMRPSSAEEVRQALEAIPTTPAVGAPRPRASRFLQRWFAGTYHLGGGSLKIADSPLRTVLRALSLVLLVVAIPAAIMVPGFLRARQQGQLTACKSNLKNIGTALDTYSNDNEGRYPTKLVALVPKYLKVVPMCVSARADTYSATYRSSTHPDEYTVYCGGHNHGSVSQEQDYPQYTSRQGLIAQ